MKGVVNVSLLLYSSFYFYSKISLNCWSLLVQSPIELVINHFFFSTFQELERIVLVRPFWSDAWPCDLLQPTEYEQKGHRSLWGRSFKNHDKWFIMFMFRYCGNHGRSCQDKPYISLDPWKTSRSRPAPSLHPLPRQTCIVQVAWVRNKLLLC